MKSNIFGRRPEKSEIRFNPKKTASIFIADVVLYSIIQQ